MEAFFLTWQAEKKICIYYGWAFIEQMKIEFAASGKDLMTLFRITMNIASAETVLYCQQILGREPHTLLQFVSRNMK